MKNKNKLNFFTPSKNTNLDALLDFGGNGPSTILEEYSTST